MDDTKAPRALQFKGETYRFWPISPDQISALGMIKDATPAFTLQILSALGLHALGEERWNGLLLKMATGTLALADLLKLIVKIAEKSNASEDAEPETLG